MRLVQKTTTRVATLDYARSALKIAAALAVIFAALHAKAQYPDRGRERDRDRNRDESIQINFGGYELRGETTLDLRAEIQRQDPRFDQRAFDLTRVILVAKSEFGRGDAQIEIGGYRSERRVIDGRPEWYRTRDPRTFYDIDFLNNSRFSNGGWYMFLHGNIMIDRIILIGTRTYNPPPYPGPGPAPRPDPRPQIEFYEGGSERVQKFIETTHDFSTRRFDELIYRVRITGTKERVRITRAVAEMQDGRYYEMPELVTVVKEGQEIGAILNGAYIRRVIITASSDNITGSRAEYKLDFGVRTR